MTSMENVVRRRRSVTFMPASSVLATLLLLLVPKVMAQPVEGPCTIAARDLAVPDCSRCHGEGGVGRATDGYPRLAGLSAAYLERQLRLFRDGERQNSEMGEVARQLTDDAGRALAACYAGLATPKPDDYEMFEASFLATGEHLASVGRWADNLPACNQCHGPQGVGVGEVFPRLAGQRFEYIENQLRAWREGHRSGDPLSLMGTVAVRLEEADIRAVAAYYASLPVRNVEQDAQR
ncbi:c-type cytochrome [Aurantimonas endophytica]|uniref:Cytochrome c553 n=1 Tax=Aurantimonas endophytica TaxID=1522175 RepID=A0A7W6HA47_9HYPH|nr:c-type cytochrome [Aurantimonas endophytica]MBB4001297.1 cytochrome c553 [Aurantimonas endophytica]MCO6403059.1 c-type cytochrome [Aurantimonas endophytica]